MIYDLQDGEKQAFETDVCIVGSGAAGLSMVREFFDTNVRVLVLESGGGNREGLSDSLNEGINVGVPNGSLVNGRCRVLGGTTDIWPGACIPLTEADISTRHWVPFSGWPIGMDVLRPYYARAAEFFSVRIADFQQDVWSLLNVAGPEFDPAMLDHAINLFSPRTHRYPGKRLRRQLEQSNNVHVLLHATASELITSPDGARVVEVEVRAPTARRGKISARVVVVAAGGFENARLLLLSRRFEPGGIGNRHDQVGRYFQDHPTGQVATIHTERPQILQRPYGVSFQGFPPRPRPYPKIRLSPALQQREHVLNCSANVVWDIDLESAEQGILQVFRTLRGLRLPLLPPREMAKILRDLPGTIRFLTLALRGRASLTPPKSMSLLSMAEQAPNPDSRIQLSEQRDALDLPKIQLNWKMTELDRRTHYAMATTVQREFARLGLGRVEPVEWLRVSSTSWSSNLMGTFHPTGSTRMATDPKRGVVDAHCRVHGVANLYIAGSSVFPTSGYANPTFTIVALAIRLADRVKSVLG